MKLYYSSGACSLAPHIILAECGEKYTLEKVDLQNKKTESGKDFLLINMKGYVPALELNNKEILTEVGVILQYIAHQHPAAQLVAESNSFEHYKMLEWLSFISSEIHKNFGSLFAPQIPETYVEMIKAKINNRLKVLEQALEGKQYLFANRFTILDAYLFTVLRWAHHLKIPVENFAAVTDYFSRIKERPSVKQAMQEEGLIKP
ncbi:glutathione transferase GstA [Candidatus Berkiella cookevillensis]|uniref:Glutathione S-transferase GST-6.0 n=1 Tax=Candidatus Berkiella cookevillensis TaxID=437022 RepID=A0A0Q9YH82_9GAMM|nr:glutathione transferase GstA [Candidatus Berkiella cookevillensis]MCS5708444.1 glutathione transferase GstA [Candidatus Berkiella cookevillensis]